MDHGIPPDLTVWGLANSQAVGTTITAIATIVGAFIGARIVSRVAEQTEQQKKSAVQEQLSKHPIVSSSGPTEEELQEVEENADEGPRPFSQASKSFKKIRQSVDKLISKITDGRHRRKYQGLLKTDLREHVYLLWQDDMLSFPVAELVDAAISEFYSYRTRPNEIPNEAVDLIAKAAKQISSLAK